MSGLTRETALALERRLKAAVVKIERMELETPRQIDRVRVSLSGTCSFHHEYDQQGIQKNEAEFAAFTSMGFVARFKWLFLGRL